jgi:cytochrome c oxidase assembly protein subunit 11
MSVSVRDRVLLGKLSMLVVAMFAFAVFVMPPLYNLFCDILGIGGKTGSAYQAVDVEVDTSRSVEVQFVAMKNETMPWDFYPRETSVSVHPGEPRSVIFYAHNRTGKDMVGQAIPNLVPFNVADYFHKTECFCFNNQPLASGEEADLELVFIVDPDLPTSINTLTLSYTLFDITDRSRPMLAQAQ